MATMTESQKVSLYGEIVATMNSASQPDKVYEVRRNGNLFSCNCRGFIFNKRCKHIAYAVEHNLTADEQQVQPIVKPVAVKPVAATQQQSNWQTPAETLALSREIGIVDEMLAALGIHRNSTTWRKLDRPTMAKVLSKYLPSAKPQERVAVASGNGQVPLRAINRRHITIPD